MMEQPMLKCGQCYKGIGVTRTKMFKITGPSPDPVNPGNKRGGKGKKKENKEKRRSEKRARIKK